VRSLESRIRSVADAEHLARRRLPKSLALEIESGDPGPAFGRNLEAFAAVGFGPRAGVAFRERELRTTVLGHEIAFPVLIAPTGNLRINHPDAEPGVARAAGAAGTIHCVSTFTGHPIEAVTAAATGPVFFQLYFAGGRRNVGTMIDRARPAGCAALIVTLDTAAKPQAERHLRGRVFEPFADDLRTAIRFLPQAAVRPHWLAGFLRDGRTIAAPMALRPDGSVMSMPGSVPTLRVLPEIVAAVGDEVEVLLDSGVRRGGDVVKALALGARAVLVGRACLWAHAAAGEAGVRRILAALRAGIDDTLALLGCPSVAALDPSYVTLPPGFAP
jgi:L-lactate dehydrogenase (cytochrome)